MTTLHQLAATVGRHLLPAGRLRQRPPAGEGRDDPATPARLAARGGGLSQLRDRPRPDGHAAAPRHDTASGRATNTSDGSPSSSRPAPRSSALCRAPCRRGSPTRSPSSGGSPGSKDAIRKLDEGVGRRAGAGPLRARPGVRRAPAPLRQGPRPRSTTSSSRSPTAPSFRSGSSAASIAASPPPTARSATRSARGRCWRARGSTLSTTPTRRGCWGTSRSMGRTDSASARSAWFARPRAFMSPRATTSRTWCSSFRPGWWSPSTPAPPRRARARRWRRCAR